MTGEFHIAELNGSEDPTFRVSVQMPGTREIVVKFEISAGDLMRALTGRLTMVEFRRTR